MVVTQWMIEMCIIYYLIATILQQVWWMGVFLIRKRNPDIKHANHVTDSVL